MKEKKIRKNVKTLVFGAVLIASAAAILGGCKEPAGNIPLEVLLGNPDRARVQISPEGDRIAYLRPVKGILNVWIRDLESGREYQVTRDKKRGIVHYAWDPRGGGILYVQDKKGDENWHLFLMDLETGESKDLTPYPGVRAQIIEMDKHYPDEILIALNQRDSRFHDAFRLNLRTGEIRLEAENNGKISGWAADRQLRLRLALETREEGGYNVLYREDPDSADWKTLFYWDFENSMTSGVIGFSKDGRDLYLLDSRGTNTARLVRRNISTGESEEIFSDPEFEISNVMLDPESYEPVMIGIERAKHEWTGLDEEHRGILEFLDKNVGGVFHFSNRTFDNRFWIVSRESDTGPVDYYLFNREEQSLVFLFSHRSDLKQFRLQPMRPVQIKARDGLTLHSYLVLPESAQGKVPLMILVHGGPWTRDSWGLDVIAQWLADRGMASLQVNFRGSTGFGKKFVNAANREWGGKMLEDLMDAKAWAIREGFADPDKVMIMGGSYGGYAALSAAAFYPEDFSCVLDFFGPSNLITLIENMPPYWSTEKQNIMLRVGDPVKDRDFLISRSPLFHASRIQSPVFIAQGKNDPRVLKSESDTMVAQLKKNKVKVKYVLIGDEGHGFLKSSNRLKVYREAESFIRECLKQ